MVEYIKITDVGDELFEEVWQIYNDSFPREERRECEQQSVALRHHNYIFAAIVEGGHCVGVVGYWLFGEGLLFLEHLAIRSHCRGGGVGARVVEYLKSFGREVVLEIEPVVDELTQRRRRFYERLGFVVNEYSHRQPPFREGEDWLPLVVMSYPDAINFAQYDYFRASQLGIVV